MADRWASFDCYGTLIDWNSGIGDALTEVIPGRARDELLAAYHAAEPAIQAGGALPYREVVARAARAAADALGVPLAPGAERALPASLPTWPPFPEVSAALAELRARGWRVAVLSNTDPELLAASLSNIGVPVDLTITVVEAGSYKPAHGHWDEFFARSGADPSCHVHVAASIFHDLAPCAARGIPTVWINPLAETSDLPRVAELPDLATLPEILDDRFLGGSR